MATGWAGDGAVQDQIDATVKDAIKRVRSQMPHGASLTHCERPVVLPTEALSGADVERSWARDRVALVKCGANLAALDRFYENLLARLGAARRGGGR